MEAFAFYLLKSVIWLSGFALVYLLFLRNERYFLLNRFYLIAGILASMFFPFISIHYTVILPVTSNFVTGNITVTPIENTGTPSLINFSFLMIIFYISGALFVVYKVFRQSTAVIKVIKKAEVKALHSVKLIRTPEYTNSFSFFSYVFVNPSVTDIETEEIVNHEMAHIRQWHWFDLVLVELLCMLQWFNPVSWIYIRFIKHNHEYLADEVALQRSSDPAIYRATLLNQIVGYPVIILANSFNSSINKKRFIMMKNKISSPYRKLKLLLILPVIAVVLYSFARPEYKYISDDENNNINGSLSSQATKEVKGTVVNPSGLPLNGATVVLRGTISGVTSDSKGFFHLKNVPEDGVLIVSYVGFKTKALKPVFTADMKIRMESDTVTLRSIGVPPPPPPPPPPLYVIDGKVSQKHYNSVKKENTESIKVLKTDVAIAKYGDKAKYGAIEITTKNKAALKAEVMDEKNAESIPPPPPPPPPPSSEVIFRNPDGSEVQPLFVIDGINKGKDGIKGINPDEIGSMNVLKDEAAIDKYGVEGRDGVIEITTIDPKLKVSGGSSDIKVIGYGQQKSLPAGGLNFRSQYGGTPLIIVNGFERDIDINEISPDQIESISVKKDVSATSLYGEKAKDGVIEITLKPGVNPENLKSQSDAKIESVKVVGYGEQEKVPVLENDAFMVVEEMPAFPGGEKALQSYIYSNIKVLKGSEKISEPVIVVFTVDSKGKVRDAKTLKKKYPVWEEEAIRVVSSMPDWKPGMQHGIPVDVIVQLPIDFNTVKK